VTASIKGGLTEAAPLMSIASVKVLPRQAFLWRVELGRAGNIGGGRKECLSLIKTVQCHLKEIVYQ
jgi:hypothetical protein